MAEFALVLPLFLLLVMGIAEFSYVFIVYTSVFNAAREGARFGMAHGLDHEEIRVAAEEKLLLVDPDAVEVTVSYDTGPNSDPIDVSDVKIGHRVLVHVAYDVPTITPLIRPLFPSFHIDSRATRTILSVRRVAALAPGSGGVAGNGNRGWERLPA